MKDRFDFKHFSVQQDRCAMKVGTDGVLLGAWAALPDEGRILDAGCGTGLIALMAAQRMRRGQIVGVELDEAAAEQAAENVAASPWGDSIEIVCGDIRHFEAAPFDTMLSNPPYYDDSLLPPDAARATARHTQHLSFDALCLAARRLLRPDGTLQVVLPAEAENRFLSAAAAAGYFPERRTCVLTRASKPVRRVLLRLSTKNCRTEEDTLTLMAEGSQARSADYEALTKDFYL